MGLTSCTCRLMRRHWLSGPASYKIYMGSFIYCFTKKKKQITYASFHQIMKMTMKDYQVIYTLDFIFLSVTRKKKQNHVQYSDLSYYHFCLSIEKFRCSLLQPYKVWPLMRVNFHMQYVWSKRETFYP